MTLVHHGRTPRRTGCGIFRGALRRARIINLLAGMALFLVVCSRCCSSPTWHGGAAHRPGRVGVPSRGSASCSETRRPCPVRLSRRHTVPHGRRSDCRLGRLSARPTILRFWLPSPARTPVVVLPQRFERVHAGFEPVRRRRPTGHPRDKRSGATHCGLVPAHAHEQELAVENVCQFFTFLVHLVLDVKAICESKDQDQGSQDADPLRSP
ncbi:hypothetical protein MYIN104542_21265 [Mycobacterium intermedium]